MLVGLQGQRVVLLVEGDRLPSPVPIRLSIGLAVTVEWGIGGVCVDFLPLQRL